MRAILWFGSVGLGVCVAFAALGTDQLSRYDQSDPDYTYVTGLVREGGSSPELAVYEETLVDLSVINKGDWQFLCIIGAYSDPAKVLADEAVRRGLALTKVDPVPLKSRTALAPVEENEGAISFVDKEGHGRTILIDGFERLAGQHDRRCYGAGTREIAIPISNSRS